VEAELSAMFSQAEKQYPVLTGKREHLLHGSTGVEYASYHANHRSRSPELWERVRASAGALVQGKDTDRQGVLSQKIPTFDNRGPEKCRLFPHLRVAAAGPRIHGGKVVPESLLPAEATLLMKLKNFRFIGNGVQRGFSAKELGDIFQTLQAHAVKAFGKRARCSLISINSNSRDPLFPSISPP
jgi:hypothetical protein